MTFNEAYAKSIFYSTTFWGAVVSLFFSIAPHFSATVFGSTSQTQIVAAIMTGIGFFVTVYGRMTAKQTASWTSGPTAPPTTGSGSQWIGGKSAWIIFAVLLAGFSQVGCKLNPAAVSAGLNVADQVVVLAEDDLPGLQVSGALSAADAAAATKWLTAADTILKQGVSCTAAAGATSSIVVSCIQTVASGLISPAEQANLNIVSAGGQHKIALYVTAVILAVNGVEDIAKLVHTTVPPVGATPGPGPTTQELHELRVRAGISAAYGY